MSGATGGTSPGGTITSGSSLPAPRTAIQGTGGAANPGATGRSALRGTGAAPATGIAPATGTAPATGLAPATGIAPATGTAPLPGGTGGTGSVVAPATGVDAIGPTQGPAGIDPNAPAGAARTGTSPATGSVARPATGVDAIGPTLGPNGADPTVGPSGVRGINDPITSRANNVGGAIDPATNQPIGTDPLTGRPLATQQGIDPVTGRAIGTNNTIDPLTGRPVVNNTGIDPVTGQPLNSGVATDPLTGRPTGAQGVIDPATGRAAALSPDAAGNSTGTANTSLPRLDPSGRVILGDQRFAGTAAGAIAQRTFGTMNDRLVPFNGGLRIGAIDSQSFAGLSGLRTGDTIRAVNSAWVRSQNDLAAQLNTAAQSGNRAWVLVDRNGQPSWMRLNFTGQPQPMLGVQAQDAGGTVRVSGVDANSLAYRMGLQAGDQIVTLNGHALNSNGDLITQLEAAAQANGQVFLTVRRYGTLYQTRTTLEQLNAAAGTGTATAPGL